MDYIFSVIACFLLKILFNKESKIFCTLVTSLTSLYMLSMFLSLASRKSDKCFCMPSRHRRVLGSGFSIDKSGFKTLGDRICCLWLHQMFSPIFLSRTLSHVEHFLQAFCPLTQEHRGNTSNAGLAKLLLIDILIQVIDTSSP